MKIQNRTYVAIEYTLSLDSKEVVDRTEPGQSFGFVFGGSQVITGLEKGLEGMEKGQKAKLTVEPEEGYGQPRTELYCEIPRQNFPSNMDIEPNMIFESDGPNGPVRFRVKELKEDVVMADLNHPLAGERLHFEVNIVEVREASAEELAAAEAQSSCAPESCACCSTTCD
ncbi:MAG: peptidylprolyl isomerase [Deltaproteobacteria bacterium]|nr:MAG: peptidylprolyl isomerase [Deltaproteobacteria bacterium]